MQSAGSTVGYQLGRRSAHVYPAVGDEGAQVVTSEVGCKEVAAGMSMRWCVTLCVDLLTTEYLLTMSSSLMIILLMMACTTGSSSSNMSASVMRLSES